MARCLGGRDHDGRFLCDRQVGARFISWQRYGCLSLWCRQLPSYPASLGLLFVADFTVRRRVHAGLRNRIRRANAARDAAEQRRATQETELKARETAVAGEEAKIAEAQNKVAKAGAEIAQSQKEKTELQTKLEEKQNEIASLQKRIQEAGAAK